MTRDPERLVGEVALAVLAFVLTSTIEANYADMHARARQHPVSVTFCKED